MEFDGEVFEQISAVPMGRAWAPAVASIFMDHWDALVLQRLTEPPLLYKRFLDDVLVIAQSEIHAHNILVTMGNTMKCIKIGTHNIGHSVNYLDIQLTLVDNWNAHSRACSLFCNSDSRNSTYLTNGMSISTQLYRKPLDLGVVIDFKSGHSFDTKVGVLFGQCARICRLSTRVDIAGQDVRNLIELMVKLRHCPSSLRRRLHKRLLLFLVRCVCCIQRINGEREQNQRASFGLSVPLVTNTHYLQLVLNNFAKRLSLAENDRVSSRIVFTVASNFGRILIYK
jgi:hypothetical protein